MGLVDQRKILWRLKWMVNWKLPGFFNPDQEKFKFLCAICFLNFLLHGLSGHNSNHFKCLFTQLGIAGNFDFIQYHFR